VQLSETASWLLVIGYVFCSLVTAGALFGMWMALRALNAKLEDLVAKADPLLAKTDEILTVTHDKIASIGDKAEEILAQGEETAESVHHKVDKTATAVQRTIHAPIIGVNSLAAGISRGVETFGKLQKQPINAAAGPVNDASEGELHTSNGHGPAEKVPTLAGKEIGNGG
jgi:hypothetical protein